MTKNRTGFGLGSEQLIKTIAVFFSVEVKVDTVSEKKRLQKLHELLISPIADLLPQNPNERVVFIPQSSLFLVPFPALQDKKAISVSLQELRKFLKRMVSSAEFKLKAKVISAFVSTSGV